MSYVLFLIYLVLFSWLLTKSRFIINAGISVRIIIALFVLKVVVGCVHGWIAMRISILPDTLVFHKEGLIEYHLLFSDPKQYISNFFISGYRSGYAGLLSSTNSFWNDLPGNIIIKFLSLCDIFSLGHYYVNVIFYNFVIFFGAIGVYRVFNTVYKNMQGLLIGTCFLLPSLLFFSSTIHKEGLIFAAIGIAVFNIYQLLHERTFVARSIIYITGALGFIFFVRNYVLLAFLPAIFAWTLCEVRKYPVILTFLLTYIVAILFFNMGLISPAFNFAQSVANKQQAFEHLPAASTAIPLDSLQPVFKSYVTNALPALNHSLLRPYFSDYTLSTSLIPLSIELFMYELLLLLFIFFKVKLIVKDSFVVFGLFFSISILLFIGYTVPVIGAIVRYRSIYLPFLLTPIVCSTNWQKLKNFIQIEK